MGLEIYRFSIQMFEKLILNNTTTKPTEINDHRRNNNRTQSQSYTEVLGISSSSGDHA